MITFTPNPSCNYKYRYDEIFKEVGDTPGPEGLAIYRSLILDDLFFIVCFVMGIEKANHPFVVEQCKIVESGPKSNTLDVWARFHYKSVIITQAETLQYILKNPTHCNGIFAYARPLAKAFLRSIKLLCEESELLKACFPDVIWEKPDRDAPKWSEDDGLVFKGHGSGRKESTLEAWGLVEGMPTGRHFERTVFDDIETDDIKDSPDMLDKVFSKFEMSYINLGTGVDSDIRRVIGTYYSHTGPIKRIQEMLNPESGVEIFKTRIVPGSDDGTASGNPVLMEPETWAIAKASRHFNSQQLCDPTPVGERKFHPDYFKPIDDEFLPPDLLKFMVIDPAGDKETQSGKDSWAMGVWGVKPTIDDVGASDIYLLDCEIAKHSTSSATDAAVRMYLRNGVIQKLGVEKVGQATAEVHICNALRAHGRHVSTDNDSLVILKPESVGGTRKKSVRLEHYITWPLNNGKIHYCRSLKPDVVQRLKDEMDKFPFWHDDGLDLIAYLYQLIKDFRFQKGHQQPRIAYSHKGIA